MTKMNIKRIKLQHFKVILTPLSSRDVSCSHNQMYHEMFSYYDFYIFSRPL